MIPRRQVQRDLLGDPGRRVRAQILEELDHPSRSAAETAVLYNVTEAYVLAVWDIDVQPSRDTDDHETEDGT